MSADGALTIFIVDNEQVAINLNTKVIEHAGHTVHSEMSALMAISKIKSMRPDCVLSDLNMEQINGLDFCKELRAIPELSKTAIIMVSGEKPEIWEPRCLAAGADAFISKPIQPMNFAKQVADIVQQKKDGTLKKADQGSQHFVV